jgi:hypothetical protein
MQQNTKYIIMLLNSECKLFDGSIQCTFLYSVVSFRDNDLQSSEKKMTSWITLVVITIAIINVVTIGTYIIIKLILKNRSQHKKSLKTLTKFIFLFQVALVFLSLTFIFSEQFDIKGYLYIIAIISLLWMLYELNYFERIIYKTRMSPELSIINVLVFIFATLFVLLPQNYWFLTNFDQIPEGSFSFQPISFGILIILTSYYTIGTVIRSGIAMRKILDPFLNRTLRLLNLGFKVLSLIVIFLCINALVFIISFDLVLAKMIIEISNVCMVIIGLISINYLYVGLTLPKFVYKRVFKQYSPMWENGMEEQQHKDRFEREFRKLHETFFD